MFTVTLETGFKASHELTYAGGEKEELHFHDWQLRVAAQVEELDENGLAVDFVELKAEIDGITAVLDNSQLEDLGCFAGVNASAENVAKYIFDELKPQLPAKATLKYVEVMEAKGCWAKFSKA